MAVSSQGVAMPAMNNILSKWIPVAERSRALALVYSGMYLGSVTGLAVSPALIHRFGWPSVFYSFGSLGSIWFALWLRKVRSAFCYFTQMQTKVIKPSSLLSRHIAHQKKTQNLVRRRKGLSWVAAHQRNLSRSFLGN